MNDPGNPIRRNEFFMGVAELSAQRSKDPHTKVGACITSTENQIVATGYNGMPVCENNNTVFPWKAEAEHRSDTKYPYVVHAAVNAILNNTAPLQGSALYVTKFPCCECAKLIAQSGIKTVLFKGEMDLDPDHPMCHCASVKIFEHCGVEFYNYN
jgi:dCMP deaminase